MSHISHQTIWKLIIFICVFSCSFRMKQAVFEIAVRKNISLNEIRESLLDNGEDMCCYVAVCIAQTRFHFPHDLSIPKDAK